MLRRLSLVVLLLGLPLRARAAGAPARIFVDPGHGGLNQGAVGQGGLQEKVLTLDIALRLRAALQDDLGAEVQLSRTGDTFVGLRERTRMANRAGSQLFLSVHVNSAPRPTAHGVETYLLDLGSAREEGLAVVRREEGLAAQEALGGPVGHAVRLEAAQRASYPLARDILDGIVESTGAARRGVRQAAFAVLKEAQMPAVVIEVGYLSNPEEAARLATPEYREKVAVGIARGVARWLKRGGS